MLALKPQEGCHHKQEGLAVEACGLSHTQGFPEGPTTPWMCISLWNQPFSASNVITTAMVFLGFKKPQTIQWPWRGIATIATACPWTLSWNRTTSLLPM